MTRALMPGRWNRDGRAVPDVVDTRNCYMGDMAAEEASQACAICREVEDDHSLAALVWIVIVAILAVGSFFAGLLLGSRP